MNHSVKFRQPGIVAVHMVLAAVVILVRSQAAVQSRAENPKAASGSENAQNGKWLFKVDGCYECDGYKCRGGA